jgi:DNA-directed RNA polymerase beta' subunit
MSSLTHYSKIHQVYFYVLGSEENAKDAKTYTTNKELLKSGLMPVPGGPYDDHMGTTDKSWLCKTCYNRRTKCPGHFGAIKLKYPIKSPMFRNEILKWLKIICFKCGNLVDKSKKIKAPKSKLLAEYVKNLRGVSECTTCKEPHPVVSKDKADQAIFYATYGSGLETKSEQLFNHEIQKILEKITDQTLYQVGKPTCSHPKKFILNILRVSPNTTRPDIRKIGGNRSNNSDTTSLLKNIVELNNSLPPEIPSRDLIVKTLQEMYHNLDMTCYEMIKGTSASGDKVRLVTNTNKTPKAIAHNIPKKEGRIRSNLMGKRVKYMIRSVITCDTTLKIDEVGIPLNIAKSVQIPETVQSYNKDRLIIYFMNKKNIYPGCSGVIKKENGKFHQIEYLSDYILKNGDIILRDMITGDGVAFNRQPSLIFSNISRHRVIVLSNGNTLRMNVSACNYYNADFDGDNMNAIVARDVQSRNEIELISSVGNWFISHQTRSAKIGAFQDSLVGIAELTKTSTILNKWNAMQVFSQIDRGLTNEITFDKKMYSGRDLISKVLPAINYPAKKAKIYMEQFAAYIKYDPLDIEVVINHGKLISGILDKATIGQNSMGSIFQIINNEYGSKMALNTIYNFQQIANGFFNFKGFTMGIADINISTGAMNQIKQKTSEMILNASKITEKLNKQELIAPIGITVKDFYEMEQLNALESGDDFVAPILNDIDFDSNQLARLVFTGSKGKATNVIAINAAFGSVSINGKRPSRHFGWGRTSPYFLRYDMDPKSLGYVAQSFKEGISPDVFPFVAGEARDGIISNALSTSVTGHQNRLSIKNMESIIVDNLRKSMKEDNLVQPLYAESGIDPRRTEKAKFLTVMGTDEELKKKYHSNKTMFAKKHQANLQPILDVEFQRIVEDRNLYRSIFLKIETDKQGGDLFKNTAQMPVNVFRVIEDTIYNYKDEIKYLTKEEKDLDPRNVINKVNELCNHVGYLHFNKLMEFKKTDVPEYIENSLILFKILIRSYLNTSNLMSKKANNKLLDIMIEKIKVVFKQALIDYGTSAGIIAAQCVSEPLTQYVLDSKHRVGQGGTKTNTIVRVIEIMSVRDTKKMKNPSMLIYVLPEYEMNKIKVKEIANYIEMMDLNRFVHETQVFYEDYGTPVHARFMHERKIIQQFEKYNVGIKKPANLTKWCIRFSINKEELVLNNMKLDTIVFVLQQNYPDLYLVYTPETADTIIIRCYILNTLIKTKASMTEEQYIISLMRLIRSTIIRGIKDILSTNIIEKMKTYIDEKGAMQMKKIYVIDTLGTNLKEVLYNPHVDKQHTQTDSLLEFADMFGIEAARNKIITELQKAISDISLEQCTIIADEMVQTGEITSIRLNGLQQREPANIGLHVALSSPIQTLENAAINGYVNKVSGISSSLLFGKTPEIGTLYNKVILNEQFVHDYHSELMNVIDDEL